MTALGDAAQTSLVLASKSESRMAMLTSAGVAFESWPADVDERAIEARLEGQAASQIARGLAEAKASAVAPTLPERIVLGGDSLVTVEGQRFDKPRSREEAREHLCFFSGRRMVLHSGAALARDQSILWHTVATAHLQFRELSEAFIADYLDHEWPAVSGCVGVFRIEARGVQLFESMEGDQFTILGMPLLAVLKALRDVGIVPR